MLQIKSVALLVFISIIGFSLGDDILNSNYAIHKLIRNKLEYKNLTSRCEKHLWMAVQNVTHLKMPESLDELWALKMLDASSKLPSGILSGHLTDLGAFDQCVNIEHQIDTDTIRGNYCKAKIPIGGLANFLKNKIIQSPEPRGAVNLAGKNPNIWVALCIPSSCTVKQINDVLNVTINDEIFKIKVDNCQSLDNVEAMTPGEIVSATFFCLIIVLIILSTSYDLYINYMQIKPLHVILLAFSFYTNGRKLLTVTKSSNQLSCLHGIRFISMMWVVLGHTYYTSLFAPSVNPVDVLDWARQTSSMIIVGATVSVDTFFVLGGLLISYVYLKAIEKGVKFNIILYYVHRYIRLTPAFAAIVLLHATLLKYFGFGPFWPEVSASLSGNCAKYWWSSLLYIQNYVNPSQICLSQSWYLSTDMQIFLFTPLALIPLGIWPQRTIIGLWVMFVISMIIPFTIAWVFELPGLLTDSFTNPDFNAQYYVPAYTRFGPVVVGLILGYYIYDRAHNFKINSFFENIYFPIIGWIVSLGTLLTIVFASNNINYHDYNQFESSFYIAVHRVVWSVALSWMIYACIWGYGGPINKFLSLPVFQILSRLTYSMYLIHLSFQTYRIGVMRVPLHFGDFENMHAFWGDIMYTAFMAVFWTLAFESPMIVIEKMLFKIGKVRTPRTEHPINKVAAIA